MKHRSNTHPTVKYSQMNSVPKLFSCSYADCWTEKHFSTEFCVLTPNHTHSHTLFWGCVSRWFGRALAWHARGQRFDPAILHQKSTVLCRKYGAFLFAWTQQKAVASHNKGSHRLCPYYDHSSHYKNKTAPYFKDEERCGFLAIRRETYIFSGTLILNMVSTLKMAFLTPMQRARRACWRAGSAP